MVSSLIFADCTTSIYEVPFHAFRLAMVWWAADGFAAVFLHSGDTHFVRLVATKNMVAGLVFSDVETDMAPSIALESKNIP